MKEYIAQFILIVFSVVLGLFLSERIEERKKNREAEELLTTIVSEVKDNYQLLNYWVPYHQEIKKNLDSLSQEAVFIEAFKKDRYIFFETLFTRGTFMGRKPANDAWDIAKSHPLIVNINYDKYLILSRIYSQQELTFEPAPKAFELFNSKDVNSEENAATNLGLIADNLHELVAREKELMYYYKQAAEILNLKADKKADKEAVNK
ncbi:MAG: hypothetical protein AAGF77_13895 [Bacteroidota bacterium]